MPEYNPREIEAKWLKRWSEADLYRANLKNANYSGADTYGRYWRMVGNDVFQSMSFDALGIQGENYALQLGENPAIVMPRNVTRYREEQIKRMGAGFFAEF